MEYISSDEEKLSERLSNEEILTNEEKEVFLTFKEINQLAKKTYTTVLLQD